MNCSLKSAPARAAGETLRKYWLPVGLSSEINSEAPKLVRWLGEDLLLFRDEFGRVGLTEPNCPHRGASLDYGWIEAGGIRCCYHGWVFDVNGRCLEQPGEPPGSNFKDKISLKAYPVREFGGMIWAYMGSGAAAGVTELSFSLARRWRAPVFRLRARV